MCTMLHMFHADLGVILVTPASSRQAMKCLCALRYYGFALFAADNHRSNLDMQLGGRRGNMQTTPRRLFNSGRVSLNSAFRRLSHRVAFRHGSPWNSQANLLAQSGALRRRRVRIPTASVESATSC